MIIGTWTTEPRGQLYRDLVAVVASFADRALLVFNEDDELLTRAEVGLLEELAPWCQLVESRSEWPGTTLLHSTMLIHEYATTPEVVAVLQETVSGIYEWQGPLPEDLAFLRADGSEVMVTIAHEEQGWLSLHEHERDELLRRCPEIAACLEWSLPSAMRHAPQESSRGR